MNVTPKVASYSSVLYYFTQNYINWKYYADDRKRDYVGVLLQDFGSSFYTKAEYQPATSVLTTSILQYIDEDSFTQNEVYTDITISSSLAQDSRVVKIKAYDQYGVLASDLDLSVIVNNTQSYGLNITLPLGILSNYDEQYLIEIYFTIKNIASTVIDRFRLSKSLKFTCAVSIPLYTPSSSIDHSHSELVRKSTLNRVSNKLNTVYIDNENFGGALFMHSEMHKYALLLRVKNNSDNVYINNEFFGSTLFMHTEFVSRTNKTY